jgi:hypothetical protein
VIDLKRLPAAHHGEGVQQELIHARAERLHLGERPFRALDQAM